MTVYELIQDLTQYRPEVEVYVKAQIDSFIYYCTGCKKNILVEEDAYALDVVSVESDYDPTNPSRKAEKVELYCKAEEI